MGKVEKIFMTYDDLDKYCDLFDGMDVKANRYCPSKADMYRSIIPNIDNYILFLLWIDETGITTEENKEDRKFVKDTINRYLTLCEEDEYRKEKEKYEADHH